MLYIWILSVPSPEGNFSSSFDFNFISSSVSIDVYAGSDFSSSMSARRSLGMMSDISEWAADLDPPDIADVLWTSAGLEVVTSSLWSSSVKEVNRNSEKNNI